MLSLLNTSEANQVSRKALPSGSHKAPRFLLFVLSLTLVALATDQYFSPILHSTSPLWATAAFLLLVWRHGQLSLSPGEAHISSAISAGRITLFVTAHLTLIVAARLLTETLQLVAGTATLGGTLLAAAKLFVLFPTLLLLPFAQWRRVARLYAPEAIAAVVVLITFFPRRALETIWPWYGQVLGQIVFSLARLVVPGLTYIKALTPTLSGPDLDVTIIQECSGINGLELFDVLFAFVLLCDWNRLWKRRAFVVYFAGLLTMFLGNALRITSFVVLGNHGFAESVTRFHISAGWIFFSVVFLVYLFFTYSWMLKKRNSSSKLPSTS
jgi:exosortase/archaeosortase family protein